MTFDGKNNLLWVQYTPGAAGRLITLCCTTSEGVGDWLPNPLPNPVEFITNTLCNPVSSEHMNTEIITPYYVGWYTRNQIFTRGDDLTVDQVRNHLLNDPLSRKHLLEGMLIANCYNKTYLPDWFSAEILITIYADSISKDWLLDRRSEIFYEWSDTEVKLLRYIPEKSPIADYSKLYDPVPYTYSYKDKKEFLELDFAKENVQPGPGLNLPLSNVLYGSVELLLKELNTVLPAPVNSDWCTQAIKTWRQRWT